MGAPFTPSARQPPPALKMPPSCQAEDKKERSAHPQGLLLLIDAHKAATAATQAILQAVPAGCNPVRVATSPDSRYVYVTARGDGDLLRFSIEDLHSHSPATLPHRTEVGSSPVGLVLDPTTGDVWVAVSDRFHVSGKPGAVRVTANSTEDVAAKQFPLKNYPRDLALIPGEERLIVALYADKELDFVLARP